MLENAPTQSTMTELLGQSLFEVWQELCSAIDEKYDMERLWNTGGKNWTYEYKYRRGDKTLCSLYAKRNCVGFMIIFGKDERAKFEAIRDTLSDCVCRQYAYGGIESDYAEICCVRLGLNRSSGSGMAGREL